MVSTTLPDKEEGSDETADFVFVSGAGMVDFFSVALKATAEMHTDAATIENTVPVLENRFMIFCSLFV